MARILIVDDSSFMCATLQAIVEKGGHEVVGVAVSCEQSVEMYKELKPDLVTLDYVMEGNSGLDALKQIIQLDSSARTIMITALGQDDLKEEVLQQGAGSYLVKPPNPKHLLSEIDRLLNG